MAELAGQLASGAGLNGRALAAATIGGGAAGALALTGLPGLLSAPAVSILTGAIIAEFKCEPYGAQNLLADGFAPLLGFGLGRLGSVAARRSAAPALRYLDGAVADLYTTAPGTVLGSGRTALNVAGTYLDVAASINSQIGALGVATEIVAGSTLSTIY